MAKPGNIFKKFPRVFWISNIMELFERWAWYGVYNAFALYLTLSKETGALGFSQIEKGMIMGTGTMLLYFLPLITGAISDRVGFKKVLILSFTAYVAGYFMVGTFQSFPMVFGAYIFLAVAGSLFKPVISGMIAKTTNTENSSVGFGIFYMMVNIGGFIGPFIAGFLYKVEWKLVFLMSIVTIAINFIFVLFFFREPDREPTDKTFIQNVNIAFRNIFNTLIDWRYDLFLLIMSVFWTAFNQLYYSFPVFLEQWVHLDRLSLFFGFAPGTITAPTVASMDAFFIIILQIYISSQSMKLKPLHSISAGIMILGAGLLLMFFTQNPWLVILGVLVFAVGEMASSPKYTEYVGRIAPSDKKALYMGTSFLPLAIGHFAAGWISGKPFEVIADKYYLLTKALVERGLVLSPEGLSQNEFFTKAQGLMNMDATQLDQYLWNKYHPSHIWFLFTGIAVLGSLLLILYDRFIIYRKEIVSSSQ